MLFVQYKITKMSKDKNLFCKIPVYFQGHFQIGVLP